MRTPGCGRLVLPLLLLAAAALAEGDAKGLKEGETPGNFMEDEQWLSSISQYSGKIKHWNRFRDVSLQGREGRGRGFGEEGSERSPKRRERRPHVAATGSAAQSADRTESKQRAPTLPPAVAGPARRPLPETIIPPPPAPGPGPQAPQQPRASPEQGVAPGARTPDTVSTAGRARRRARDARGVQGGRGGSPGCGWTPDRLPSFFGGKKKRPPGLPPAGWMLQAPHTGHCRRGRSGCGRRLVGSIVLRECPLFPPWALGEGGQKGTEPWAGTLNWGWG